MTIPERVPCKGMDCEDELMWVQVERRDGGRRHMPLDVDPVSGDAPGLFVFIEDDVVRAIKPGDTGPFFVSHFSTCPNADDFRAGAT